MLSIPISIRIHCHRFYTHTFSSLEHTTSNLSSVSYKNLLEWKITYTNQKSLIDTTLTCKTTSKTTNLQTYEIFHKYSHYEFQRTNVQTY